MKTQWIVVANASLARVFRREWPDGPLLPLPTMQHPQSRAKSSELGDDRPGHEASDFTHGGTRLEPRADPHRKEHRRFAHDIAEHLDAALTHGEFDSLAVFASAPFLGELKGALSEAVLHRLQLSQDSDLTTLDVGALEDRLRGLRVRA